MFQNHSVAKQTSLCGFSRLVFAPERARSFLVKVFIYIPHSITSSLTARQSHSPPARPLLARRCCQGQCHANRRTDMAMACPGMSK